MPTYNSARYIGRCLESFRSQTFEDWELVCVDKGSSDGTRAILDDYAREWSKLRVMDGGDERTSQINIAVKNSSSKYIYYTASDFEVDRTLLAEAYSAAESVQADGVYIDCKSYGDHYWARVRNLERSTYVGSVKFEAVRFFRREAYLQVGGYDDAVPIFEEYDLQDRLFASGCRFVRIKAAEHHLGEPESLREIWNKSYYYGRRYKDLLKKQGAPALRHANPMRATFFRHWKAFLMQPVLTAGFIVMVCAKYAAGALGLLVALASRTE
jgi:glycosyltransferase involved in cell wall biosynthesis